MMKTKAIERLTRARY